jgi:PST family polysaccharide transporter
LPRGSFKTDKLRPLNDSEIPAPPAKPNYRVSTSAPLGKHSAHGFAWMLMQTIVGKGAGMLGQVLIAWFLSPHDFKLVGLTFAVTSFPSLLRDAGLATILVQRQHHLRRWVGPIFWMSLMLGVIATALMLAAAPLAARFFGQPQLAGLICVIAVGSIFSSLNTVSGGMLQIQLRFRFLAILGLTTSLLLQAVSVLLAWRGWGAYSYAVANAVVNVVTAAAGWYATWGSVRIRMHPYLRRWRFLVGDSGTLLLIYGLFTVIAQGDYLCLGAYHKHDDAGGVFFFAFNLSWQMVVLLTNNVGSVLYPAMARLQSDPPRQMQAYLRSARVLALVAAPACFLQAVAARPVFALLFKTKWAPAIPVMQALSFGMTVRCVGATIGAINISRGRYRLQLIISAIYAAVFMLTMALSAKHGGALAVAIAEASFYVLADPITLGVVLWLNRVSAIDNLRRVFLMPTVFAGAATAAGWAVSLAIPHCIGENLYRLGAMGLVSAGIYSSFVRKFAPDDWKAVASLWRK